METKVNVSSIIQREDQTVLIQKRSEDEDVFPGLWGIPGGTVEESDISHIEALKREILEEVDIQITDPTLIQESKQTKPNKETIYKVYISHYKSGVAKALDGTAEIRWVGAHEIEGLDFTPTTKETLTDFFNKKN